MEEEEFPIPAELYEPLKRLAEKLGRSVDDLVVEAITKMLKPHVEIEEGKLVHDYVTVTVKIPKNLYRFMQVFLDIAGESEEAFIVREVIDSIDNILNDLESVPWLDKDRIIEKYGLKEILDC